MTRQTATAPLLSFADPQSVERFLVVDDHVMGGVSTGRVSWADELLIFEGILSLANNGGFASFRGNLALPPEAGSVLLHLRGDGRRYKFTFKHEESEANWQYQAPFQTTGDWQTLRFEPGDFTASFRGRPVDAPRLSFRRIRTLGVLIADRQAGPFRLELHEVRTE